MIIWVVVVLVANVVLFAWAMTKYNRRSGLAELYNGDCDYVSSRFPWVHLAINICGTILLASSNTAMQIVSAPTRAEIDRAHPKMALDIGFLGYQNWPYVATKRKILWALLTLSSLPLTLL